MITAEELDAEIRQVEKDIVFDQVGAMLWIMAFPVGLIMGFIIACL